MGIWGQGAGSVNSNFLPKDSWHCGAALKPLVLFLPHILETGTPAAREKHGLYSSYGGFVWDFTQQLQARDFLVCVRPLWGVCITGVPQPAGDSCSTHSPAQQDHPALGCAAALPPAGALLAPTPPPGAKSSLFKVVGSPHPI